MSCLVLGVTKEIWLNQYIDVSVIFLKMCPIQYRWMKRLWTVIVCLKSSKRRMTLLGKISIYKKKWKAAKKQSSKQDGLLSFFLFIVPGFGRSFMFSLFKLGQQMNWIYFWKKWNWNWQENIRMAVRSLQSYLNLQHILLSTHHLRILFCAYDKSRNIY